MLFGVLAGLPIAGLVEPAWRRPAVVGTSAADLASLVLALRLDGTHSDMDEVVIADVVSLVCLGGWLLLGLVPA